MKKLSLLGIFIVLFVVSEASAGTVKLPDPDPSNFFVAYRESDTTKGVDRIRLGENHPVDGVAVVTLSEQAYTVLSNPKIKIDPADKTLKVVYPRSNPQTLYQSPVLDFWSITRVTDPGSPEVVSLGARGAQDKVTAVDMEIRGDEVHVVAAVQSWGTTNRAELFYLIRDAQNKWSVKSLLNVQAPLFWGHDIELEFTPESVKKDEARIAYILTNNNAAIVEFYEAYVDLNTVSITTTNAIEKKLFPWDGWVPQSICGQFNFPCTEGHPLNYLIKDDSSKTEFQLATFSELKVGPFRVPKGVYVKQKGPQDKWTHTTHLKENYLMDLAFKVGDEFVEELSVRGKGNYVEADQLIYKLGYTQEFGKTHFMEVMVDSGESFRTPALPDEDWVLDPEFTINFAVIVNRSVVRHYQLGEDLGATVIKTDFNLPVEGVQPLGVVSAQRHYNE